MQDADLLKAFLDAGANANTTSGRSVHSMRTDGHTKTPVLHQAVRSGNVPVMRALLDAKADVNAAAVEKMHNERGYNRDMSETALHIACATGTVETVAILLQYGADIDSIRRDTKHEQRSEEEMIQDARRGCGSKKSKKAILSEIDDDPRSAGYVCPVQCISIQETASHIAARRGDAGILMLLVCAGANLSVMYGEHAVGRGTGNQKTVEDLCSGREDLLHSIAATWPETDLFCEADWPAVEAAIATSRQRLQDTMFK